MSKAAWLLLSASIILNSSASLLLKKGASALASGSLRESASRIGYLRAAAPVVNIYTVAGLSLLVISFVMFLVTLSKVSVSVANPILALSYVLVAVGAFFIYGEPLTANKIVGIAVIVIGVTILSHTNL